MPITPHNPFKGRQYSGEVIVLCVRWYLRYPLSYEHVAELMAERGVEVDASCIWRWVQAYAPELNKRGRPHLKPTNKSYRVDETYIKCERRGQVSVSSAGFHRADDRLSAHGQTRYRRSQTFSPQGYRRIGQCHAAGDERGQESGISGCRGIAENRSCHFPPSCLT